MRICTDPSVDLVSSAGSLEEISGGDAHEIAVRWLPYDYVTYGLADDWWSLSKSEWIDTGEFGT